MSLHEMHYKETTPEETVQKLENILKNMKIEVEEHWAEESIAGTYSLRLNIKGTGIGSNGKGITKKYAKASAYAEFFERLQNDILISAYVQKGEFTTEEEMKMSREPDGKNMSAEEIIDQGGAFIDFYFKKRNMLNATRKEKVEQFKSINKFEYMLSGKENEYWCVPFFSCRDEQVYYLPKHTYRKYYGSNGMAAGNKPAEALVQGYSEILERISQTKIFIEKPVLPVIPDKYIKKFPYIYDMYNKIRKNDECEFTLLDCSFGGKYPVAGLLAKRKNTGCFGLKLGCHPDFALALERTITEAAQGNDLTEYINRSVLDFDNVDVEDEVNIENSFKTGLAQYPYNIFDYSKENQFVECEDVGNQSNEELFKNITNKFLKQNYDVLIRDVSNLGFPSYHIIIPGLSELKPGEDKDFRASNTRAFVSRLLMQPRLINKNNCKYITATFGYYLKSSMSNTLTSFYPEMNDIDLPAEKYHCGIAYFSALCEALGGNYDRAEKYMEFVEKTAFKTKQSDQEIQKMRTVRYYFSGMKVLKDHDKVIKYLGFWFDEEYCSMLENLFRDKEKMFVKQYPDGTNWRDSSYFEPQRIAFDVVNNLRKQQIKNPIIQEELIKLL